jgi:hypothetical protein
MKRRNRDEWRAICEASVESALTNRDFAEAMGMKAGTLSYSRCKLRQEEGSGADFIEVESEERVPGGGVVVDVGDVRVTMATLPPARWLAELAASC